MLDSHIYVCSLYCVHFSPLSPFFTQVVDDFVHCRWLLIDVTPLKKQIALLHMIHFGHLFGKFPFCLIVKYMFILSIVFVSHHYSHFLCWWWMISLIVGVFSLMYLHHKKGCIIERLSLMSLHPKFFSFNDLGYLFGKFCICLIV